ncbi:hypothetical protein NA57DRAFT_34119 [Rhizodiscina lignyota]|uniref:Uncharacterized protein n=1 Tax=Rhizodiscina lignyota TaxID=1504668 RepID=A0A9P4MDB0_9PEZI|nr:hypothetical protein NA57DRAFT_34119 [Rhizodiscina lignyota]
MEPPSKLDLQKIAEAFLCDGASKKLEQYATYLEFYEKVICPSSIKDAVILLDNPVFESHDSVIAFSKDLRADPSQTHNEMMVRLNSSGSQDKDKAAAIRSLVRVTFMLDCESKQSYPAGFTLNDFVPLKWEHDVQFVDLVQGCFPRQDATRNIRIRGALAQKKRLKAWKLKKRYNINFRATDDIREHLLYDPEERSVKIFHHTGFLKAQLLRSLNQPIDLSFEESLKIGTLPPQLLLETLDSIHFVLFPIGTDSKSKRFLDKLVQKEGFDPNAKTDEGHVREPLDEFLYEFWGDRLLKLLDIVDNPPPANWLVAWFERHTSERNALTVAIVGLFLSVIFSFLGLLVSIAQLIFAILQWRVALHPPQS